MRSILLFAAILFSGALFGSDVVAESNYGLGPKQAEYYDFGKGADITFIKWVNGTPQFDEHGEPITEVLHVLWVVKAEVQSVSVAAGGDGVKEDVYIYQRADGAVDHTVAARWRKPKHERPVERELTPDGHGYFIDTSGKTDAEGNWIAKKVSRFGRILSISGDIMQKPPKMRVEVFCRCNGAIESRHWVQVMMDGKPHDWPKDQ